MPERFSNQALSISVNGDGHSFTRARPTSMYCPPVVWRQWTARTFFPPGFSADLAAGSISTTS